MNKEILVIIKNRLSESDFRKIDFDEPIDKFYYYGDHPIKRLPITNDEFITYIIKYYQCRKSNIRTIFEQKNLQIDMYRDNYHIVDFDKLKSQEKELFDSIINDAYFSDKIYKDMHYEFEMHNLKKNLGID